MVAPRHITGNGGPGTTVGGSVVGSGVGGGGETTTASCSSHNTIGLPLEENDRYLHDENKENPLLSPPSPPLPSNNSNSNDDARDASTTDGETCEATATTTTTLLHSTDQPTAAALELRVQELEEKLATLSLLLSRQRLHNNMNNPMGRSISPSSAVTPPPSPPPINEHDGGSSEQQQQQQEHIIGLNRPVLDSPAPIRHSLIDENGRRRRNLSFRVLHGEDDGSISPATAIQQTLLEDNHAPSIDVVQEEQQQQQQQQHRRILSEDGIFLPQELPDGDNNNTGDDQHGNNNKSNPTSPELRRRLVPKSTTTTPPNLLSDLSPLNHKQQQSGNDNVSKSKGGTDKLSSPLSTTKTENVAAVSAAAADPKSKWLDYLNSVQESNYDTDKQMEEFVKVPSAVESLLSFGFWICVDSFLYILTILPIRFVWSCLLLMRYIGVLIFRGEVPEGPFRFHRRHSYQLIQVSIIYIIYKFALMPVSIGMLYHWIRGQAMVKLYVLIAMVEVFDRLLCSLGQDCLDSLYWNTTRRPRSSRLIVSVIVVLVYTMVHSFLLFVHLATLNVAMNSDDQALISLLIGGNFAEIKSTVFKKYNKATLFKITASDICERFKLALYLVLVLTLNMAQGMDEKTVLNYVNMCGIVWCAEWLSDWIKHSFITKFNYISSKIYPEYALLLAGDVTGFGHEGVNLDHSHAVVKRIGFAQLPLVCVLARYLKEAYKYGSYNFNHPPSTLMVIAGFITCWSVLLVCKLSLGSFLHKICRAKLESAPEFSKKNASVAKKIN